MRECSDLTDAVQEQESECKIFIFYILEINKEVSSASLESSSPSGATSQPMWFEEIEYVQLEKGDRGLGFSILDYQVRRNLALKNDS